jgi:hypothetical protein
MSQLYAKNGLILGPIPKISPKSNFLKKLVTRLGRTGTLILPGFWFQFWFPKTRNRDTPVPVPGFGQKLGNQIGLTPLDTYVKSFKK